MTEISYSRLRAYLDCPWLFKLIFVDRKRTAPTADSSLGGSLHRALACFYERDGSEFEQLAECYEEGWLHMGFATPQEQAAYHARGLKILKRYWGLEQDRRSKILFNEKEFEFALGGYKVRGIIDRIDERPDGTIEVIDYKSLQDPQDTDAVARNVQLQIYGLAVREALKLTPAVLTILYLSAGRSVSVPYDLAREEELRRTLSETAALMEKGGFEPDTRHCPDCPFQTSCQYSVTKPS